MPGLETLLRKYFFVVHLLALGGTALLVGRAASRGLIEPWLRGAQAAPAVPFRTAGAVQPTRVGTGPGLAPGQNVLARNMFCSTCVPPDPAPGTPERTRTGDGNEAVRTTLRLQLVSTVAIGEPDGGGDESYATIKDLATQAIGLFTVGSRLPGGEATLESIEVARVFLRNGGKLEFLDLTEGKPGDTVIRPGRPGPGPAHGTVDPSDLSRGVRRTGENQYEIDRGLLEKLTGADGKPATTARMVPSQRDGKPDGIRVYGVSPDSLWAAAGIQNGDTVHAINGLPLTGPDSAREIYAGLKNARHLSVSVTRQDRPLTLGYRIR